MNLSYFDIFLLRRVVLFAETKICEIAKEYVQHGLIYKVHLTGLHDLNQFDLNHDFYYLIQDLFD